MAGTGGRRETGGMADDRPAPAGISPPRAARDAGDAACPVRRAPDGSWQLSGPDDVRALLRSTATRQGGFAVEHADSLPGWMRPPVLWRDGPEHREHRRQTARFFTEKRVDGAYRELMRRSARQQVAALRRAGEADLAALSFASAVTVVAQVIGLRPGRGTAGRLERFFTDPRADPSLGRLRRLYVGARSALSFASFHLLDVRPAVRARRRRRRDDLVSHLIDEGCRDGDILGECMTFAAAGMITTREFVTVAAWHLFTDAGLRARWDAGDRAAREELLHGLLRREPVVSALHRVTTAELPLPSGPVVPAGSRVAAMLVTANRDPAATGSGLAFGDGPHKCPGSHLAVQESEIFLSTLFAEPGLRMVREPTVAFRPEIEAYELTGLRISVR
jgi:cytochrome P450